MQNDSKIKNLINDWIKTIVRSILIALFIKTFIFNVTYVKGESMYPTLKEGDILILKKYETLLKTQKYKRGDIIVFKSPFETEDKFFIKRVVALPGDKINISNGYIYINDRKLEEYYIKEGLLTEELIYGNEYNVTEDEIFVIGDNRLPGKSSDSRSFGGVNLKTIEGKVIVRIFPLSKCTTNL